MKQSFTFCMLLVVTFCFGQSGNVGIGVPNPQAKLHTKGSVLFDTLKGIGRGFIYADENGNLFRSSAFPESNMNAFDIADDCPATTSSITVSGMPVSVKSGSIKIRLNVTHSRKISDVAIYLVSPTGEMLNLAFYDGGNSQALTNVVFWDSATSMLGSSNLPISGSFKPKGSNSNIGCSGPVVSAAKFGDLGGGMITPNGVWTLRAKDAILQNGVGKILNWSISFNNIDPPAPSFLSNYILKTSSSGDFVGSTIYDDGNVGIGTTSPAQKLDVAGTIKAINYLGDGSMLNGIVNVSATQAITGAKTFSAPLQVPIIVTPINGAANMVAVAYGNVYSTATTDINNSSNNCTLNHTGAGVYEITLSGNNLNNIDPGLLSVSTTLYGTQPGFITFTGGGNGKLIIRTFNTAGTPTDRGFGFSVFKP